MAPRAGIVVTGTEVLTGRVADRNGPWLAEQLRRAGVDVAEVIVVGDRPDDLRACLTFLAASAVELIITSGGLGPTDDDLTARTVADFQGRPSEVDPELHGRIAAIIDRLGRGRGWRLDPDATAAAVSKQSLVPAGAGVLAPVGTAPGLVVPPAQGRTGPPVIVLPGPPRELQPMWPLALAHPFVRAALGEPDELRQATMRLWGTPESELTAVLRRHGSAWAGLEITTCLRDGELEIVTRFAPDAQADYAALEAVVSDAFADTLYSPGGETIDERVAGLLRDGGLTIATAESCTAGLLAGRLTNLAGSSDYVMGGLVVYSDRAKHALAGVAEDLIGRVGAVSAEVARALADGARERLGTSVGVGITGVAGPGGGTPDKPVGLVHLCVTTPNDSLATAIRVPGNREDVRTRSVTTAMHMIRTVLGG